jgi:hypothetical protein
MSIYDEIRAEREAQDQQWGGPAHDDDHDGLEWLSYVLEHTAKALSGVVRAERGVMPDGSTYHERRWTFTVHIPPGAERNPVAFRRQLVRVAALAVAAIEAFDRRRQQG